MDENKLEKEVELIAKREQFWQKYILQIVILIFVAGGGWVTLENVSALAEDNHEAIEEAQEDQHKINEKLVRIETTQEFMKKDLEAAKEQAKENSDKLDKILEKLSEDND